MDSIVFSPENLVKIRGQFDRGFDSALGLKKNPLMLGLIQKKEKKEPFRLRDRKNIGTKSRNRVSYFSGSEEGFSLSLVDFLSSFRFFSLLDSEGWLPLAA
jgi:hypothetical protein